MRKMNALHNCKNPNQTDIKKCLCICSAGLLRSPTMAGELYKRGYNARSAGLYDYALIEVDEVLYTWCDIIFVAEEKMIRTVEMDLARYGLKREIKCFNIQDHFRFRDMELILKINHRLDEWGM